MTMKLIDNAPCGYRFLTGIPAYSSGVVAMPGHEIVHATLQRPLPFRAGFEAIASHLAARNRPRRALCAIELRSSRPFSFDGFDDFNNDYRAILSEWEILLPAHNPVARSNVAPLVSPPSEPSLYAFSYTVASETLPTTFVVAGAADIVRQSLSSHGIIRAGETSADAMAEKARHVMAVMEARLAGLGAGWPAVTAINVYTAEALRPYLADTLLAPMGATAVHGVHWHLAHPPIEGLAFEMDLRGVDLERRL
ncbi:MAG: RidA family protein [Alphaproteobacteria bacterium]|jgi:hypothetical protein|nr:RidA family protein [Alphaproteobacteria bacterium]